MGRTFEVHIDRYDPRRAPAAYCQRYEIESHSSMTVLELLTEIQRTVDDTLAFRTSCQIGKCGSCAVSLNGRPVLACRTVIDGPAVRLGPLPHFQPLHDLIVDREQFEDRRVRVIADALGNAEHPGPSFAALPDEHVEYGNVARCIGCLVCDSVCPVAAQVTDRYSGPALLSTSLSSGVRIRRRGLLATPIDGQMEYCSLCLNCELACPSGVALNRVNAQAKHEYTQEKGQSVRDRLMGHVELV